MKKKFLLLIIATLCIFTFTACGNSKINLSDCLIEERNNLFTGQDSLYCATFSSGKREESYALDGVVNNMVDFGIVTFARLDRNPMANDNYTYIVKINDETFTGFLEKSPIDNSYSADIATLAPDDAVVTVQVSFTGYSFNKELANTSSEFAVDKSTALNIANSELKTQINNLTSNKNNKIEAVMKVLKDYSSGEVKNYYWYIGVVSTNGDTLGVLINALTGDVTAKKV